MIKTKLFNYLKSHKHRLPLCLFLIVFVPCLILLPQPAYAGWLLNNLAEFFVKTIATMAYGLVVMGLTMINLSMEVSTNFIAALLEDTQQGSLTALMDTFRTTALSFLGIVVMVVAFAQVLHLKIDQWGARAVLPKLFFASFLSLFSTLICTVIYDFGTLVTHAVGSAAPGSVLESTVGTYGIKTLFEKISNLFVTDPDMTTNIIAAVIFFCLCLFIFLGYIIISLILYFRTIVIIILIIMAPLAFVSMVLPWTSSLHKKWWSEYAKWVFYLPAAFLLLHLSGAITLAIIQTTNDPTFNLFLEQSLKDMDKGWAAGSMMELAKLFIPGSAAFALTIAAIFVPFKLLGKAGSIASNLTKKAGRSAWQASPGGTAQNMLKQVSTDRAASKQSKAGRRLSSLRNRISGGYDEFGAPKSESRAKLTGMAFGRDPLVEGRALDKNTSEAKQAGVTTAFAEKFDKAYLAERKKPGISDEQAKKRVADRLRDPERGGDARNYRAAETMKTFSALDAHNVAQNIMKKAPDKTTSLGALQASQIMNPASNPAERKADVTKRLSEVPDTMLVEIDPAHLREIAEAFGGEGDGGEVLFGAFANKLEHVLNTVKPETQRVMIVQLKQAQADGKIPGFPAGGPADIIPEGVKRA